MPSLKPSATRRRRSRGCARARRTSPTLAEFSRPTISISRYARKARSRRPSRRLGKARPPHGPKPNSFWPPTGIRLEAENLASDDPPVACAYKDFPDHFGFFLPLAGITTVRQISENSFDIRATSRLNRLYVELLKDNPEWGTSARRHDMNHFMARLIFCFFAEDTDIFIGKGLFTDTIAQMSAKDSSNTHAGD